MRSPRFARSGLRLCAVVSTLLLVSCTGPKSTSVNETASPATPAAGAPQPSTPSNPIAATAAPTLPASPTPGPTMAQPQSAGPTEAATPPMSANGGQPTASPPPTPQPGLVSVRRQFDVYIGNLLVANGTRSLVWCFDPSETMVLRANDAVDPYVGTCPSGVIGFIPEARRKTPALGARKTAFLRGQFPRPLASLPPGLVWHVRIYRPAAPPTP
jgi:hypothetical protein